MQQNLYFILFRRGIFHVILNKLHHKQDTVLFQNKLFTTYRNSMAFLYAHEYGHAQAHQFGMCGIYKWPLHTAVQTDRSYAQI